MISFINLGNYGRLGNQLFQYAALRSIGEKRKADIAIPQEKFIWHSQTCLLDQFNIPSNFFKSISQITTIKSFWAERDEREYDSSFFDLVYDGEDILGFFQNTKYFKEYDGLIKKELMPKASILDQANKYLDSIRGNKEVVSVHIRRGDVVEQTSGFNFFGDSGKLETNGVFFKYLNQALSFFGDVKFLIFTGGSRAGERNQDIEWCKQELKIPNSQVCEGNSDILDFAIMLSCDHNIMCHSSTFGWWAGYLNNHPQRKVIAPKYFLAHDQSRFIEGFYPESFTLI